jgi:hypothetical protein
MTNAPMWDDTIVKLNTTLRLYYSTAFFKKDSMESLKFGLNSVRKRYSA